MNDRSHRELIIIDLHYVLAATDSVDNFSGRRHGFAFSRVVDSVLVMRGGRGSDRRVGSYCRAQDR